MLLFLFFFNHTAPTAIYTLSLHDALPISYAHQRRRFHSVPVLDSYHLTMRSEEHTSELQSLRHLVCRLLLEKKKEEDGREVPLQTVCRAGSGQYERVVRPRRHADPPRVTQ